MGEAESSRYNISFLISVLINGRGRKFEVSEAFLFAGNASIKGYTPFEVFNVSQNYR